MFRAIILPILRSTRLCVTVCGIMHRPCCRRTDRQHGRCIRCIIPSIHPPRRYKPCRVLTDTRNRLQPSLSMALILQFLTPSLSASLVTPSIRLRFGLPARLLPSGLSKVIFLHGRLFCIRTIYPAHLSLVILIDVTKSVSSYRRYI